MFAGFAEKNGFVHRQLSQNFRQSRKTPQNVSEWEEEKRQSSGRGEEASEKKVRGRIGKEYEERNLGEVEGEEKEAGAGAGVGGRELKGGGERRAWPGERKSLN